METSLKIQKYVFIIMKVFYITQTHIYYLAFQPFDYERT
jgi:hypothetical protein